MRDEWMKGPYLGPDAPVPIDRPFTRQEVRANGVGDEWLATCVRLGLLRHLFHGVYVAAQLPDTLVLRTRALGLVISEDAVVCDRTAAWLHGVAILPRTSGLELPDVQIVHRTDTHSRREGVDGARRGLRDRDVVEIHGVQATTPLRTALDLGRLLWRFDSLAAMDGFLRIGVLHERVLAEVERFRGYRGVRQLRALAPLADGRSESPGESALRLHWYDAGLPPPELQHWVYDGSRRIYRLDLADPDVAYGGEYDGEDHHTEPEDVAHDARRRTWIERHAGFVVDAFHKDDVYGPALRATEMLQRGWRRARRGDRGRRD